MKKILFMKIMLLAGLLAVITGCGSGAVRSKDECLAEFFSNAQAGNWESMYQQIHPDNSDYNSYKSGTTFRTLYIGGVTYSVSARNGDSYTVIVNTGASSSETFNFRREEEDLFSDGYWSIISFTNGGTNY